ncbi:acyltransferase family protein [Vibrio sp. 10N.222.49.C9]|uniref:acyltransferase family protein n=1 Tax=Vibrio sp. 10N.222.49.C9 TaxID=3229615 RepID=UPI003551B819
MLSYRRELDGLRALAVIAVIIYHANLKLFGVQLFQGGFFGVDVFFVLSGYLITGIIRNQMDQGTFSFRDFYWRRAKRILPALLTMLLVTSGLAYLILLPDDLVTYARSLQSTLYFGSNHFFYGEDSYTAVASIYRPLLHTWSLSVEWQFYVVFPFIVWGINRFFPEYLFGMLLILALVSLQFSSFIVKVNPDMAFYLLPTRSWELILGGLVTFYNRANVENLAKGSFASLAYQSLPIIGLFLIVHSMTFIGHEVQHPSFITLLPVLGTSLFIMFSHKGEVSNDAMSLKPVVGIGLISYSLYLWHQPVFVFFRLLKHDYFRFEQFLLLSLITIIMSTLTYYGVERFFRKNRTLVCVFFIALTFLSCLFLSIFIINNHGFPKRFSNTIFTNYEIDNRKLQIDSWDLLKARYSSNPDFEKVENKILIIGNSHSKDIFNAFSQNKKITEGYDFLRYGVDLSSKRSLPQINCFDENNKEYSEVRDLFYNSSKYIESTAIIISSLYGSSDCLGRKGKHSNITDLEALPYIIKKAKSDGKKVFVFGETAIFNNVINSGSKMVTYVDVVFDKYKQNGAVPLSSIVKESDRLLKDNISDNSKKNKDIKEITIKLDAIYIDKISLVCDDEFCSSITSDGYKTMYDHHHWTLKGAKMFGKRLIDREFLKKFD